MPAVALRPKIDFAHPSKTMLFPVPLSHLSSTWNQNKPTHLFLSFATTLLNPPSLNLALGPFCSFVDDSTFVALFCLSAFTNSRIVIATHTHGRISSPQPSSQWPPVPSSHSALCSPERRTVFFSHGQRRSRQSEYAIILRAN